MVLGLGPGNTLRVNGCRRSFVGREEDKRTRRNQNEEKRMEEGLV